MTRILLRKITKSGKNTLAISIPKDYAIANDLEIGDEVEVVIRKINI